MKYYWLVDRHVMDKDSHPFEREGNQLSQLSKPMGCNVCCSDSFMLRCRGGKINS